jgi:hypothetical protein
VTNPSPVVYSLSPSSQLDLNVSPFRLVASSTALVSRRSPCRLLLYLATRMVNTNVDCPFIYSQRGSTRAKAHKFCPQQPRVLSNYRFLLQLSRYLLCSSRMSSNSVVADFLLFLHDSGVQQLFQGDRNISDDEWSDFRRGRRGPKLHNFSENLLLSFIPSPEVYEN